MHYHHHQSVLPKGRSFTASAGTKDADLLLAGLPLQTQEPRLQFYHGRIGVVAFHCFPNLTLSLASEQTLMGHRGNSMEARRMDLANWILRISPKFTTGVKYHFHQGFFTRREIRKSQSPYARDRDKWKHIWNRPLEKRTR